MPKGVGWKTPMVARVSKVPMVPRVLVMLKGCRTGWTGTARCFMSIQNRGAVTG